MGKLVFPHQGLYDSQKYKWFPELDPLVVEYPSELMFDTMTDSVLYLERKRLGKKYLLTVKDRTYSGFASTLDEDILSFAHKGCMIAPYGYRLRYHELSTDAILLRMGIIDPNSSDTERAICDILMNEKGDH